MIKISKIIGILTIILALSIFSCASKNGSKSSDSGDVSSEEQMTPGAEGSEGMEGSEGAFSLSQLERVYFDFNDATLTSYARETLKKNAEILSKNPGTKVSIEGHCDERGSVEYNLALGERRADNIRRYLATLGVSSSSMTTISYGEEKPLVMGHGEDSWSKNRRGEIIPR